MAKGLCEHSCQAVDQIAGQRTAFFKCPDNVAEKTEQPQVFDCSHVHAYNVTANEMQCRVRPT